MPIYEYRCRNGHTFDVMQRFSDDPVTECEVCGARVERVFRPPAVHFKGSGFYNTDYGTRKRAREKEAAGSGSGAGSSGSGSSDAGSSSSGDSAPSSSSSSSNGSGSSEKSTASSSSGSTGKD